MKKFVKIIPIVGGILLSSATFAYQNNAEASASVGCDTSCNQICFMTPQGTTFYGHYYEDILIKQ